VSTIKELGDLKGRVSIVTGATGHLGKVISETLAELGSNLILIDMPKSDFSTIISDLKPRWGVQVETYSVDLELPNQRKELISSVVNSHEELNCLINNAAFVGTSELPGWNVSFEQQTNEMFSRALEVNLTAVFDLVKGFSSTLKNSKGANIINIASIYGLYAPDWNLYEGTTMNNPAAYGASKAGLIQLTRWLSSQLAPQVRVNSISPGGIFRNQEKEFVQRYQSKTPLGRMATEDDLKGAIAYLASDLSKYVTGQNLSVDGGWGVL
jgi:NAD(P)-dependent dehydrogenase (short-subunit alcohol dehydrogenase family)